MRVLVTGATGCVGAAVVHALRARGHAVVEGSRGAADGRHTMHVDYMQPRSAEAWSQALRRERIEVVVNCVGILMPARGQSFERVHTEGPIELFRGAALAGVDRVLQVSALGVGDDAEALATPYLRSKLMADDALASLPLDWAVLRPSLVYGPRSQSAALFATLASLPVISLPRHGWQQVQPLHVYELAEAMARLVEQPGELRAVHELAGPAPITYRDMLAEYRRAQGLGEALWLPVPMPLMKLLALAAEALPQQVYCRDTLRLLERGNTTEHNALPALLGRRPTTMAQGLAVTAPQPLVDLRVQLSPAAQWLARGSLAFMWLYTSLISAWLPQESGVLALMARCGFEGDWGIAALVFSCSLNTVLGVLALRRPVPWAMALQVIAVIGYTTTAALNMPELTLDHCGPLVKNLPVLALLTLLWLAAPAAQPAPVAARAAAPARMRAT
ncbi:SDR family oxidoreductase [Piscinibacter gummiphilus]|uniref:SDR family oxidoreductase n=1 Tax=Piscinibacter gummiphilus TaxID=946333 RepID=A0ABZ0CXM2_9BURK|nr:SDR family oxidoreductase [Piscinibacter gummiphilus]WOB07229.1 SDR family oxidoreductase [Piscinibacter gummiphilus]